MKHFLKIGEIDPLPILNALQSNPHLWNQHTLRTKHPLSPHKECNDIWVFFNRVPSDPAEVMDDIQVWPYSGWKELPQLRTIIFDLMRRVEGIQLGRVLITRLAPGKKIPPHVDQGAPVEYYKRYQIALQSLPGAIFQSGDEVVNFRSGEVWRVDNAAEHSVTNNSADDRIVVIVDIHSC